MQETLSHRVRAANLPRKRCLVCRSEPSAPRYSIPPVLAVPLCRETNEAIGCCPLLPSTRHQPPSSTRRHPPEATVISKTAPLRNTNRSIARNTSSNSLAVAAATKKVSRNHQAARVPDDDVGLEESPRKLWKPESPETTRLHRRAAVAKATSLLHLHPRRSRFRRESSSPSSNQNKNKAHE